MNYKCLNGMLTSRDDCSIQAYLDYLEGKSIAELVLTNWSVPVGEISSASQEIKEYQHQILVRLGNSKFSFQF